MRTILLEKFVTSWILVYISLSLKCYFFRKRVATKFISWKCNLWVIEFFVLFWFWQRWTEVECYWRIKCSVFISTHRFLLKTQLRWNLACPPVRTHWFMKTDISLPVTVNIAFVNTFVLINICDQRPLLIFVWAAFDASDSCLLNTCEIYKHFLKSFRHWTGKIKWWDCKS